MVEYKLRPLKYEISFGDVTVYPSFLTEIVQTAPNQHWEVLFASYFSLKNLYPLLLASLAGE